MEKGKAPLESSVGTDPPLRFHGSFEVQTKNPPLPKKSSLRRIFLTGLLRSRRLALPSMVNNSSPSLSDRKRRASRSRTLTVSPSSHQRAGHREKNRPVQGCRRIPPVQHPDPLRAGNDQTAPFLRARFNVILAASPLFPNMQPICRNERLRITENHHLLLSFGQIGHRPPQIQIAKGFPDSVFPKMHGKRAPATSRPARRK